MQPVSSLVLIQTLQIFTKETLSPQNFTHTLLRIVVFGVTVLRKSLVL